MCNVDTLFSIEEGPASAGVFAWDSPLSRREILERVLLRHKSLNSWSLQRHLQAAADTAEAARALSSEHEALKRSQTCLQEEVETLRQQRASSLKEVEVLKQRLDEVSRGPERLQGAIDDVKRETMNLRRENTALKAEATKPTPRSNLYGMAYNAMMGTPRDNSHSGYSARGLVGITPRSAVGTPRSNGFMRAPLRGSVASLSWNDGPHVQQVVLLSRVTGQPIIFGGTSENLNPSGSLSLRRGEYLVQVEGKTGYPPNLAAWLTLTTSENQVITLGDQEAASCPSSSTSFSYHVKHEHEIVGFVLDANGEIQDIDQRLLPPSRVGQTPRSNDSPTKSTQGTISRIKEAIATSEG